MNNVLAIDFWDPRQHKKTFIERLIKEDFDNIYVFTQNEHEYETIFDELLPPLLYYFLKHSGKNIDVVTSIVNDEYNHIVKTEGYNLKFWDTYWLYKTFGMTKTDRVREFIKSQKDKNYAIQYHYVMLNNRAHDFRCKLVDIVAKENILDKGAISWNNTDSFLMNTFKFNYFDGKERVLDENFKTPEGSQYLPPTEYYQSFAQLISESTPTKVFFSEKISMALIIGKPFLAAASPYIHRYLKNTLGFELYDEIFDYSFDNELDMDKRWNMIIDNFKNLCQYSLNDLATVQNKIRDKIIYNQLRAKQIVFDDKFIPSCVLDSFKLFEENNKILSDKLIHNFQNIEAAKKLDNSWDFL